MASKHATFLPTQTMLDRPVEYANACAWRGAEA